MLEEAAAWLVHAKLGIEEGSRLGEALVFFIADSVKITLLLFFMIAAIGILRTYIPQERIRVWLSGSRRWVSYPLAALFGAVTPFCTCSSIPIFISFLKSGIPLGPTFTFLVTSPMINEYLVIVMLGFFGWKITVAYVLLGLVLGVVSGLIIDRLDVRDQIVADMSSVDVKCADGTYKNFRERVRYGLSEGYSISWGMFPWILMGVGIGAAIHGFIPQDNIEGLVAVAGIFSVPIATLIGVPLYANCSSVVPIALVLFQKGMPLGTALAFMMATSSLSLPEAVILRKVMKVRLILLFFGIVATGIVIIGYIFNFLQGVM